MSTTETKGPINVRIDVRTDKKRLIVINKGTMYQKGCSKEEYLEALGLTAEVIRELLEDD